MIPPIFWIPIIILAIIEVSLLLIALRDWMMQPMTMNNRYAWLAIILVINMIGPILYFLYAPRGEEMVGVEDDTWKLEVDS